MYLLLNTVDLIFTLLTLAIFARAILSWFVRDPYNPLVYWLDRLTDPILEPIRRFVPPIGMMDITPIIALFLLQILQAIIHNLILGLY
jgi:YggT family protein